MVGVKITGQRVLYMTACHIQVKIDLKMEITGSPKNYLPDYMTEDHTLDKTKCLV
jgi:hypothetical protein